MMVSSIWTYHTRWIVQAPQYGQFVICNFFTIIFYDFEAPQHYRPQLHNVDLVRLFLLYVDWIGLELKKYEEF